MGCQHGKTSPPAPAKLQKQKTLLAPSTEATAKSDSVEDMEVAPEASMAVPWQEFKTTEGWHCKTKDEWRAKVQELGETCWEEPAGMRGNEAADSCEHEPVRGQLDSIPMLDGMPPSHASVSILQTVEEDAPLEATSTDTHDNTSAMALRDSFSVVAVGNNVRTTERFRSHGSATIAEDMFGIVESIDKDGDAHIKFDGIDKLFIVKKMDFHRLQVLHSVAHPPIVPTCAAEDSTQVLPSDLSAPRNASTQSSSKKSPVITQEVAQQSGKEAPPAQPVEKREKFCCC
jgi:hypothetical protein